MNQEIIKKLNPLLKTIAAITIVLESFSLQAQTNPYHFNFSGPAISPWSCLGQNPTPADQQDIGAVYAVAAHSDDPQTIYIGGGRRSGLWKTTDGGANWEIKTDSLGITALGIHAIDIHPTNHNIVLAGTHTPVYAWDYYETGMGVLKSTDGGNTWQPTNIATFPARNKNIKVIRFHPSNPNIVLAAGNRFIYKSIVITEQPEDTDADCLCNIDISYTIGFIPNGEYTLIIKLRERIVYNQTITFLS